jgi:hypothetical protein
MPLRLEGNVKEHYQVTRNNYEIEGTLNEIIPSHIQMVSMYIEL